MTPAHPLEAQDYAAGRAAFAAGTAIQYNPHLNALHGIERATVADLQRFAAWDCGWIAAAKGK